MLKVKRMSAVFLLLALIAFVLTCEKTASVEKPKDVKRIGKVIGLKPEKIPEYKELHATSNPGVRDLLNKYHLHNFSIYIHEIDGKWYEFAYYEYTGDDFEGDMAKLSAEPRNIEWNKVTDAMQIPLKGENSWVKMEEVYHND